MWIVNNFSICKQRKLQSHVFRPARGQSCWPSQDRFLAPKNSNVKKYVNKYWAAFRPKDPTDLDFEVSFPCIYHNETVIDDLSIFAWAINLFFVFIFLDWQGFPPVPGLPCGRPPGWRGKASCLNKNWTFCNEPIGGSWMAGYIIYLF